MCLFLDHLIEYFKIKCPNSRNSVLINQKWPISILLKLIAFKYCKNVQSKNVVNKNVLKIFVFCFHNGGLKF
jgi:hypothetical protein